MKYFLSILNCLILIGILFFSTTNENTNAEYLRIHIRANSNLTVDQNIKYKIKDSVVDALIPLLSNCKNKNESQKVINENLEYIENIANKILLQNNFSYTCNAKITNENFPTRSYGDLTLESGFYDAVILELGSAKGDNWWCVVYPPLCFVNGSSSVTIFKSRILEIIKDFFS